MANFTEKLLNEMLFKYQQDSLSAGNSNIELEIRFKDITREAFESIYKAIINNPEFANGTLECSVNIISENVYERGVGGKPDDAQYIRKIIFGKNSPPMDTYMQKIRLMRSVQMTDYIKYSVGLSKETVGKKFATSTNALVRFKIRVSFDYMGVPPITPHKWRFDLTAVKYGTLSEMGASLKTIKNDLFLPSLTPETFMQNLNFDMIDSYEVEIEHIGKDKNLTPDAINIAKKVFTMINPQYMQEIAYQDEIYHIAELIVVNKTILHNFKLPTHRLKQLSNQVSALSKNMYYTDIYPPAGYYLTDKADGKRAFVSINGNRCRVLMSDSMLEFVKGDAFTPGKITIADAELIYDSTPDATFTLYIFDVMVLHDENLSRSGFSNRVKNLDTASIFINEYLATYKHQAKSKKYVCLDERKLENGFKEIYEREHSYIIDGLILTEPNEPYHITKNYKWKPFERTTIDFLAVKCPQKLLGIKPYVVVVGKELYLLFVGINQQLREKLGLGFIPHYRHIFPDANSQYYPIQFSSSLNPFAYLYYHTGDNVDRQIIELSRNHENTEWIFHHVRSDRKLEKNYYGNDFRIAELTYINYIDPFDFEDLWKPSSGYFTKTASNIYSATNKFKRFVISLLLKDNLSNSKWIIDEGAGRGGDLHRYQEIGVENALFIDVDATAIAELIRRKFAVFAAKKKHVRGWFANQKQGGNDPNDHNTGTTKVVTAYDRVHDVEYEKVIVKDIKSLTIHTLVADLKTPSHDLIAKTFQFGVTPGVVDGIICNFAFHYMCDTIEHMRNLLIFNSRMLKIGGLFIFTVMDGKSIHELLSNYTCGQQWESRENNVLKYAIKREYVGTTLAPAGQMISVLLPFSDGMYSEPLCNVDVVIKEATKLGFELELNAMMNSLLDKFASADRALYDLLTDEDIKYISMHKYVSLRKVKDIKRNVDE